MSLAFPRYAERSDFLDALRRDHGDGIVAHRTEVGEQTLVVTREALVPVMRALRDTHGYQQLMEIAGVDFPDRAERFEVNYCLLSVTHNHRLRVKVSTDADTPVPSVTGLWPVAGWLEREVFDLYGVDFAGNPDLRRILTDYGFEGHPLRKDFPQTGYVEMRYSEAEKRVVYEPVKLPQDFRNFDFLSPWEGPEYRLPGDEKAEPHEAGGASPAKATGEPTRVKAKAGPGDPKTTEGPEDTGAGEPTNEEVREDARDPVAEKADHAGGKATDTPSPETREDAPAQPRKGDK
ncbi:NADH-quinone oxidoreductase subunit C [Sphingomicrobium astaxanthinifaciens]|uniref:NADH-quinone oxidoreductase subunit C n=1 Tax=Sphingomicrobium astaxanthinifaciens TaxID=1227949 RepID=UPI001FCAE5CC|nr:NADH-quinone oxidoreductase subunit C [Sphingomicrobium astaxanthinifaciens]MCJ7422149.1 NADH-quinone oxidoreductase subunit C [Sphingomicrobium astaxanthinifaciens]